MRENIPRLKEICMEITDICPLQCLHCSGSCGINKREILDFSIIKNVIDEAIELKCKVLSISGGEPLCHPELFEIINESIKKNLEVILYTSGILINENGEKTSINYDFASKLKKAGLRKIVFSLLGATSKIHDYITQTEGSFINTLKSISLMKSIGFWVGVHFVPMKPNHKEVRDLFRLLDSLKVDEVAFLRFVPQGRGLENKEILDLSKEEFKELIRDLVYYSRYNTSNIRLGAPIDFRFLIDSSFVRSPCKAGIFTCSILPNGDVIPCSAFKYSKDYVAGSIKTNSLVDIWCKSPKLLKLRNFNYTQIDNPCKSCKWLPKCKGGCLAQRHLKYGMIEKAPDPICFNTNP